MRQTLSRSAMPGLSASEVWDLSLEMQPEGS